MSEIRLTEYSHGAGCGCKISPGVLSEILHSSAAVFKDPRLLVGNDTRDDAAVYDLDGENVIISTTDFFMPIVDDPFDFGGIASVNAISDIYAMGGKPIMAIAILGWPIDRLDPAVAKRVLEGARAACSRAGISLGGGHSIDAPEPIFGLAVTGTANKKNIKANSHAIKGCELYLSKPLGVGILTTAQKSGVLDPGHLRIASDQMLMLNDLGVELARLDHVYAMTDVTGFGLLGHLIEMCEGSGLGAVIDAGAVPRIPVLEPYLEQRTFPGGTFRNFESYGHKVSELTDRQKALLCDPQTSGGLLIALEPEGRDEFLELTKSRGYDLNKFGELVETPTGNDGVLVQVMGEI